ncbi:3-dehydroquinate synthase, partial [Thermodesulfobacteriota bacterium]
GGLRRILNFGHTFGHAIEGYNRFRISHGQGVAWGMIIATWLSFLRGLISEEETIRIVEAVIRLSPYAVDLPNVTDAMKIMRHDKKIRGGKLVFVLLEEVGKAICVDDVSRDELAMVLRRLGEESNG